MTHATRSRLIILTGASALVLVFLHFLGAFDDAEAWIVRRLAPHESRLSGAALSLRSALGAPFRVGTLEKEHAALREERNALLSQVADLQRFEDENTELREILAFAKREKRPPVMAHVLAATPEAGIHTVLIDAGSDDGLLPDMPVVAGDGIVVGKVFKLDRASATVLLLADTRSRIGAAVLNAGHTQGVIQGKRGLSLEMRLIPQNEAIAPGDIIVTSGIEPLVPGGLVVGRVQEIQTQEKNPFKTAVIVPPVAYDRLDVVAIPLP